MTPAAELASLLSQRFVKTTPPDLNALCRDLGLRMYEVPTNGFDGALVRSKTRQKGIVAIKADIQEDSRKRFTIAHEIGHFVIPNHRDLEAVCEERTVESFGGGLSGPEREANEFAAELLLPSGLLRQRFNLGELSLAQISAAATDFQTSLTATARAFLTLTDLPCAMVWIVGSSARWFARSDSFHFFLPLDDLPADGSFAARIARGDAVPTEFTPVRANLWLNRRAAEHVSMLLEHSISLPSYNAVLTLLWAYKLEPGGPGDREEALLDDLDPEEFTLRRCRWPK